MSLSIEDMRRIDEEERIRAMARARHAATQDRYEEQAKQRHIDKMEDRQRYVHYHGRHGAFRTTLIKWIIGAVLFAAFLFFIDLKEKGFLESLGNAVTMLLGLSAIGVVRAYHIANSVR